MLFRHNIYCSSCRSGEGATSPFMSIYTVLIFAFHFTVAPMLHSQILQGQKFSIPLIMPLYPFASVVRLLHSFYSYLKHYFFPFNVIVTFFVFPSQLTSAPKASPTNLIGTCVLEFSSINGSASGKLSLFHSPLLELEAQLLMW